MGTYVKDATPDPYVCPIVRSYYATEISILDNTLLRHFFYKKLLAYEYLCTLDWRIEKLTFNVINLATNVRHIT